MKTGKELKPGTVLRIDNDPWLVQKAEFTKSGRNSAIMKTKLKNLLTGYKTETVYGADDKLDDVILDRKRGRSGKAAVNDDIPVLDPFAPFLKGSRR